MQKYLCDKSKELTTQELGKILQTFQTGTRPMLNKLHNYYEGKQDILQRVATDTGKPCNHIVVNYCYNIVQNYLGYLTGIPISYEGELDMIQPILDYNDVNQENTEMLRQALIYGRAFEINYLDEEGKQRFKCLDTRECIPVYANDLNNDLVYVVRFYEEELVESQLNQKTYLVEVYGHSTVKTYRSNMGFQSFSLIDEHPHFFEQCPITVLSLNQEEDSIFKQVITLQDAYNQLLSDEVDDFDAFSDAYLILKGTFADEEDIESMKEHRVLMMDADADAHYLTKSISDTQIQNMLDNINDQIHKIAASPDFNDDKFMAQSGIAMRYKLVGFENQASAIESELRKALQRRIELICGVLKLANDEVIWRDINIIFTRNLPINLTDTVQVVNSLRGVVSNRTLISLLPFVKDVDEELAQLKIEQEENMALYSFNTESEEEQWQELGTGEVEK